MPNNHSHEYYFQCALEEAEKARKKNEVPIGCVIVKDNKIISRGHNLRESKQQVLTHAELIAIEKAAKKLKSWRLEGCELYVTLEPCPMCAAALWQARIKKVHFGAIDKKAGALTLGFNLHQNEKLNHRYTMDYHPVEECSKILSTFFKSLRSKK